MSKFGTILLKGGDVMYKRIIIFSVLVLFITSLSASQYRAGNSITVREGDTLSTDLFTGARYLNVRGVVDGDVYVGCEKVMIDGEVLDDVLAGCRTLEVTGKVGDGIIGFAETILIDGEVNGDVLAFGGNVRITDRGKIHGNLFVGTGELNLDGGYIGGYLKGGGGQVNLNGYVGEYVELEAQKINFGPDYFAEKVTKLILPHDISEYDLEIVPDNLEVIVKRPDFFLEKPCFYWSLLALLIVGILIIALFKNFSKDYLVHAKEKLGQNLGYGFLALLITPIVIVILMVLILTIPVGLILLAAYLIVMYLSYAFSALFIGDYILSFFRKKENTNNLFLSMFIGVILVSFLPHIPFVGWLIGLIIICFGMGSLITYIWKLKQVNAE
jgi:hypothetical protein